MQISFLTDELEPAYRSFLLEHETTMLSMSLEYRELLRRFLGCRDRYLVALTGEKIVGALPLFVRENPRFGKVYNSLPFYGGNGAIIGDDMEIRNTLLDSYHALLDEDGVASGTLITSPFEKDDSLYRSMLPPSFTDYRIGQVTELPSVPSGLMEMFHHKTRNAIRKGQKSGVKVDWENGEGYLDFLVTTHTENAEKIGIPPKPASFFELVTKCFEYGKQYRVYTALVAGEPVASLLTFYFNKTAEYYTPTIVERYRDLQPMNVIVIEAMTDAVNSGFRFWNWGGTAPTAKGVYDFKKRWGTSDLNYYYFTTIKDEAVRSLRPETLLSEFPYFYVLPFTALEGFRACHLAGERK
jgi:hypothetical protein